MFGKKLETKRNNSVGIVSLQVSTKFKTIILYEGSKDIWQAVPLKYQGSVFEDWKIT